MKVSRSVIAAAASTALVLGVAGVPIGAAQAVDPVAQEQRVAEVKEIGPPSAPRSVTAVVGDGQATISWQAPENDGGSPILFYTVTLQHSSSFCETEDSATTSCTITGLVNGTTYTAYVYAANAIDHGLESTPIEFTPKVLLPLNPPRNVTVTAGDTQAVVSWEAPEDDGGAPIDLYAVITNDAEAHYCETSTVTSCTLTGLTNGTTYTAFVYAVRGEENSVAESEEFTPMAPILTVPGEVHDLKADDINRGTLWVWWDKPENTGGSEITGYRYRGGTNKKKLGNWTETKEARATFEGVNKKREYFVQVQARNAQGYGTTAQAKYTPESTNVPGEVVDLEFFPSKRGKTVLLQWAAPANTGGEITGYRVTIETKANTPRIIEIKDPTQTYLEVRISAKKTEFTVQARNDNGYGDPASVKYTKERS